MIGLRIDVDGYYGLTIGVKNLLEIFDKNNMKATFFINMGRESGPLDFLKYRFFRKNRLSEIDEKVKTRYSLNQKIRMIALPKWLGCKHCEILREIKNHGHDVQVHAWNHLKWTKDFENVDVECEIKKMVESYKKCMNKNPVGFASPGFKFDKRVLDVLDEMKFKFSSDMIGKFPFRPEYEGKIYKHLQIPLTLKSNIEEMLASKIGFDGIVRIYKKHLSKNEYRCIYFHADYEGLIGKNIFEKLIKNLNIKTVSLYEIYKNFK
ncbi:MAG: polysaccharide deacetylase family protein [Candidatus Methanomethylicia archaeon]